MNGCNHSRRVAQLVARERRISRASVALRERLDRALVAARRAGTPYKEIADEIINALGGPPSADELERVVDTLKQRTVIARRRVSDAHRQEVVRGPYEQHAVGQTMEDNMNDPYGKPRYVREREIFYDELPPDVAPELGDDHDFDDGLGDSDGVCDDKK